MSEAFIALQRLVPQHALSRLIGKLAASEVSWTKRPFIHGFAKAYNVSLADAARGNLMTTPHSTTSLPASCAPMRGH